MTGQHSTFPLVSLPFKLTGLAGSAPTSSIAPINRLAGKALKISRGTSPHPKTSYSKTQFTQTPSYVEHVEPYSQDLGFLRTTWRSISASDGDNSSHSQSPQQFARPAGYVQSPSYFCDEHFHTDSGHLIMDCAPRLPVFHPFSLGSDELVWQSLSA